MVEYNEGEKESWNMATATLRRLDLLLQQCSYYSQNCMLEEWSSALMDLRRNLAPFMDDDRFKFINAKFNLLPRESWKNIKGQYLQEIYSLVYPILDEINVELVRVMKKKGLLMPATVDVGKSITGM